MEAVVKKLGVGVLAALVLILMLESAVPSQASARGWWWPGAVIGGLTLGVVVAGTYPYPYYYPPPHYYPSPYYYPQPPVVYQQAPVYVAPPAPLVQREVVYQNGKYVLYGDGVTQPWQWVWVPAVPVAPPAPPQR